MTTVRKFAVGIATAALVAGVAAPAVAAGRDIVLPNGMVANIDNQRLAGEDRVETALAVAKKAYADATVKPKVAYLVGWDGMPDAVSAGMIDNGGVGVAGVVLALPKDLKDQKLFGLQIKNEFPAVTKLVALGGETVIPADTLKAVAETAGISSTDRIGGATRYDTNVAIAKKIFPSPTRFYIARGDEQVDALAAGTLTAGPVLILNPNGDVPAATKSYVSANSNAQIVVLGGDQALADEQVSKLLPDDKSIKTTPWTAPEILAGLKTGVQTWAALYFGQDVFQKSAATLNLSASDVNKAYDDVTLPAPDSSTHGYFGFASATSVSPMDDDPAHINPTAAMSTNGFRGYQQILTDAKAAVEAINATTASTSIHARQQALDTAVLNAKASTGTATYNTIVAPFTTPADATTGDKLVAALVDLYGKAAVDSGKPTVANNVITDGGWFKFDSTDATTAKFVGLDTARIADRVAADKKAATLVAAADFTYPNNNAAKNLAELSVRTGTELTAYINAVPVGYGTPNPNVNLVALKELVTERVTKWEPVAKETRNALIDAIRKYYLAADKSGASQSTSSKFARIAGATRYETSAYLSVFQSKPTNALPLGGENRSSTMAEQYLVSGDNAHLIDAVFAGQLTKGTILVVPMSSDKVDDLVATELTRKGKLRASGGESVPASRVFTVGGKAAVEDSVFTAALNALGKL